MRRTRLPAVLVEPAIGSLPELLAIEIGADRVVGLPKQAVDVPVRRQVGGRSVEGPLLVEIGIAVEPTASLGVGRGNSDIGVTHKWKLGHSVWSEFHDVDFRRPA